jgi:hypothetical protein
MFKVVAFVSPLFKSLFRLLILPGVALPSFAAESFLHPHDVVAFVGGEDMVAMSEYGYLELLLTRALPTYQLRFRNLAWEGDTVFEQRRDLNFPPLEAQLDKIGATVVVAQFGQMESFAGEGKLTEFVAAYEKLIERMNGGGKRRVMLVTPVLFAPKPDGASAKTVGARGESSDMPYSGAVTDLAEKTHIPVIFLMLELQHLSISVHGADDRHHVARDAVHFNEWGQRFSAVVIAQGLAGPPFEGRGPGTTGWMSDRLHDLVFSAPELTKALEAIRAKNRLWFNYWRPQNWAFLNGDRINQPSSRDHLDPSKRWFPEEIEQFIPLIETKEREIDALAAKLAQP